MSDEPGLTLDTGALVEIGKSLTTKRGTTKRHVVAVWKDAIDRELVVTVPVLALAEFWRGQDGPVATFVRELTTDPVTKVMGLAIGKYLDGKGRTGPSMVDASVVISAATRGDDIYTSDEDDLNEVASALGLTKKVRIFGLDG